MKYRNLTHYLHRLETLGELRRISAPVDPRLEIAEITERVFRDGGPALLFERTGTPWPVVTNLYGTPRRMALALGVDDLEELSARIEALAARATAPAETLGDKLRLLPLAAEASRWIPRTVSGRGACQQVVLRGEAADLTRLPALTCRADDGGPFVTLPLVHTLDPDTGSHNMGMYRIQIFGPRCAGMHWHVHKTGARHYDRYARRGERMPVSIAVGGDPAYAYAATAPLPEGIDEYLLAGFLRRRPVKLARCLTNPLRVPADCDFVLEGWVDPTEERTLEGPFGDHTGFYSLSDLYPRFHLTAVTHRRDAVWPATIVGIPPQEDTLIARATERIFLTPIRLGLQPEIRDLHMPDPGTAHNLALVSYRADYPGQGHKIASSLWGAGQMMFNKYLLLLPEMTDPHDAAALSSLLRRADFTRDTIRSEGILDILDHATATPGFGGKFALDLTAAASRPESPRPAGDTIPDCPAGCFAADFRLVAEWNILLLYAEPGAAVSPENVAGVCRTCGAKIAVLFDPSARTLTPDELLWLGTANTDPRRDLRLCDDILLADARTKLPGTPCAPARWPNPVTTDPKTIALVDRRWDEYGLERVLESPSRRYLPLRRSDRAEI